MVAWQVVFSGFWRIKMSLFVPFKKAGLRRSGRYEYISINEDPRFVYRFWFRRPRYLICFLQGLNDFPDPRVYVDRGNGFDERFSISLTYLAPSVYVLSISEPRCVKALRFDPCTFESRFQYWATCAWTDADRDRSIEQAKQIAGAGIEVYKIEIAGHGEPKRHGRRGWISEHYSSIVALAERLAPPITASQMREGPFISFVVPVFNTPVRYLNELLASFLLQRPGSAELVFSDDGSSSSETLAWLTEHELDDGVKIVRNIRNAGIANATNYGINAASGQWISFLDHDDALSSRAVDLIAETARENPDCEFIYTDEVVTDEKLQVTDIHLKPAYDPVLLSGVNYINHLSCYRRNRLLALGGMREGYEGSQDYDLLLRYLRDVPPSKIKHLPYPAYRWRRGTRSFSTQFLDKATQHARLALADCYRQGHMPAHVDEALTPTLHRVRMESRIAHWPSVSVVIPNRDSFALISRVLADLQTKTDYPDLDIIVIDNGTTDNHVLELYQRTREKNHKFRALIEPQPFNFSSQVNRGISLASGSHVLLLNNDVEVIEPNWLREMVSCFEYPDTGVVGARLLYPSKRIQHAGVIVGLGGLAGHWFLRHTMRQKGPMGRLHVRQSLTAVTGACLLISRKCLDVVGPFDEKEFAVAFNDVDFCLRAVSSGFRVVWTPFASLIHHESVTRGSDTNKANRARFEKEQEALRSRHKIESFEDRAYSPWYTRDRLDPYPTLLEALPKAR